MKPRREGADVRSIIQRAEEGARLRLPEIGALLAIDDPDRAALLFSAAQRARERHFGRSIFMYGFVYFSTYCRNRCTFCFYRNGNQDSPRYRKSAEEVVEIALGLADSGVHLVDLTMGEDPTIHDARDYGALVDLVAAVRRATGVPVMVSPGVVPRSVLGQLRAAGADWYACYQETHSPELYRRLRPGQDYVLREASRSEAVAVGLYAEDGILLGVGETVFDRARSLLTMRAQGVQQVRVMGFVPQKGTPLAGREAPSLLAEMVTLATMRLVMPDRLIPASLDIDGLRGLEARLRAGANVVTSIIPPASGLAGVSQSTLDIDQGFRTVAGVVRHLAPLGLEPATPDEYQAWLRGTHTRCRSQEA
ncbi:MAG: methylornithine synthase PylB [Thermoleophilia bacterium]|nr:methylornithine synthase PylB [Thermoleophilia bacterium]